jgi:hypothetical protein
MQPKFRTALFILLSFLLGGVSGVFVGKYYLGDGRGWGPPSRKYIQQEFAERLKLDSAQQTKVDSIVEAHRVRFDEIRKRFGGEFRAQRESLRVEIRKELSAEQNLFYDDYIKDMERKEEGRRKGYRRKE